MDFFTRLSKIGLLKKSDRVHWYPAERTDANDADWFESSSDRSPCSCSPRRAKPAHSVNGSDENVRFHLPNDIEWEMIWSSVGNRRRISRFGNVRSNGCPEFD